MTVIFLSDRPFANCSASGESCNAAAIVENFTTIADLHAHVQYMYMYMYMYTYVCTSRDS